MESNRRRILQAAAATAWLATLGRAQAQTAELAKVVVGFPPGGTADVASRRVAERLQPGYAKATVVENRTGAGGQIAVQSLKGAPADGSTLLMTPMSMLGIYPHTYKKLPYDPLADLTPVSLGATFEFGLAVGPLVPAAVKSVPEFMDWCRVNPALASFGSPAAGSVPHFIGVLLGRAAGVPMTHVPYRGTQPALLDVAGGQLAAVSGLVGDILQQTGGGKVRLIGVSGAGRNKFAPAVPTYVEQGMKEMVFSEWYGFYLPPAAKPDVVQRLNAALVAALASPEVVQGLALMGLEAAASTPAALDALLRSDTQRWGPIVKSIGFTADT